MGLGRRGKKKNDNNKKEKKEAAKTTERNLIGITTSTNHACTCALVFLRFHFQISD